MMPKFKYKLSCVMLINIFVEVLVVLFFGGAMQLQIPTLINFWGRPVYEYTVASGDQINSLLITLIVFFLAETLIGLVSLHLNDGCSDKYVFKLPAFLEMLNIKLWKFSLLDGLVIWLIAQSWVFILIGFALLTVASSLAIIFNLAFVLFIVGTVVVNIGMGQKHKLI
ncbi:hypothetical protein SIN07_08305 [Pediococcus inopinatus]|uniref:hypothetical protein n=1 Tax=Pediococcus inopinatus TaxID=114090 RepID=UPI002A6A9455|nr:hypothetical protein [Pediococcus inopinatus]WPP09001.1 hypothetical protein SIN07_08305 [Pediococcus inopinatus]